MSGGRLKFQLRVQPMTPVHIGVGNRFLSPAALHVYGEGARRQLAILRTRPLAERLLDHFGYLPNLAAKVQETMERGAYPPAIAREIESDGLALRRLGVHPGALPYLRPGGRENGLKEATALANGLPYIPGSSVKGTLRTVWLDWQTRQDGAYARFQRDAERADPRRRDRTDDDLMNRAQVAQALRGVRGEVRQPQNRDVFRAVQVGDLVPDRTAHLTRAYAVQSMSYQAGSHARPSNGGQAGAQSWECLNPESGATYTGTLTVDLDLLARMTSGDPDARRLTAALARPEAWAEALTGYGERVYREESFHYDMLAGLPDQGTRGMGLWRRREGDPELLLDWVLSDTVADAAPQLLPLGMGTGLLAHSLLGVTPPDFEEEQDGSPARLGNEAQARSATLLKGVLDTGIRRDANAYATPDTPAPKSRRVTGTFSDKRRPQDMTVERPLGWTRLSLQPV